MEKCLPKEKVAIEDRKLIIQIQREIGVRIDFDAYQFQIPSLKG